MITDDQKTKVLKMVEEISDQLTPKKAQELIDTVLNDESRCRIVVGMLLAMDFACHASKDQSSHFFDSAWEVAYQFYVKERKE